MPPRFLAALICMTVTVGGLASTASADTIDQSFTSASTHGAQVGLTIDGLLQTFTVGVAGTFSRAELLLQHGNSTPTADLTIALWSTTAGAPNAVLTSVDVSPSDVSPATYSPVIVDFSSAAISVAVGDILGLSISSPDQYGWSAGVDPFNTYAGGHRYTDWASGAGVAWDATSTWDMSFKTYVDTGAPPVPEPGTFVLFGLGVCAAAVYRRRRVANKS